MKPRSARSVARATGGTVSGDAEAVVRGVAIDSRHVAPGDVFVAIRGQRSDGHAFVERAFDAGATAALVEEGWTTARSADGDGTRGALVVVPDTGRALLDLAADERAGIEATVVGITGSTGKTCTKDLTSAVLGARMRTVASAGSFNNEVGLPLTILSAVADTEALVCEMGARGRGHIKLLCDVARPSVGIVTNVGVAHMELFGSPEALRDAKAELPESLPEDGVAVLNADDGVVRGYAARTAARVVLYGTGLSATVRAERIEVSRRTGAASFDLLTPDGAARVELTVPGEHLVHDALAAAAAGWALGVGIDDIADALGTARVSAGRMHVLEAPGGFRVLDDSYNANPTSMAAALRSARWMAGDGRAIAVLGHMAELGAIEDEEHERIGELAARLRIDVLVLVGERARRIASGAAREGVEPGRVILVAGPDEAAATVLGLARSDDLVLVKASRAVGLDRVVAALLADVDAGAGEEPETEEPGAAT